LDSAARRDGSGLHRLHLDVAQVTRGHPDIDAAILDGCRSRCLAQASEFGFARDRLEVAGLVGFEDLDLERVTSFHLDLRSSSIRASPSDHVALIDVAGPSVAT